VGAVLFDSSVYINGLRQAVDAFPFLNKWESSNTVWLSSVVLEELYAGASPKAVEVVEKLERDFDTAQRILVPNLGDWALTGKLLARLAAKHGFEQIGRARLTNDALIAASAGRMGVEVITANAGDFARLAEFCSFTWSTR
jgi:predicted nucleic acid-binding protein